MAPHPAKRPPLDRGAVLTAAVVLADREGIGAVSMRQLANHLTVVPMALYKHVADKEDLLDGMVEQVVGQFSVRPSDGTWPGHVRARILAARRSLAEHPWLRRVIETRTRRTPAVLGHMEALTQLFLDGGLSPDLVHHAMHTLGNRIWGFSPELFNDADTSGRDAVPPRAAPRTSATPNPADYPGIMAIAADAQRRRPNADGCDEEFEFTFALDLILDAIDRLHRAGWSSAQ